MLLTTNTRKRLSCVMLPVMVLYTVLPTRVYGGEVYAGSTHNSASVNNSTESRSYDSARETAEALNKAQLSNSSSSPSPSSSQAANCANGVGAEVNAQTGQLDITFSEINLEGMSEDVGIELGLSNSGEAGKLIYGMPKNWKLSLDYIGTNNGDKTLYLNGSQNYAIDFAFKTGDGYKSGLRYCTTRAIKFEQTPSGYTLSTSKGTSEIFDSYGKLICLKDRFGNEVTYSYDDPNASPYNARLESITDSYGQKITFAYDQGSITATLPDGRSVCYDFSHNDGITITGATGRKATLKLNGTQVTEIDYPTGGAIKYEYGNAIPYGKNVKGSFPAVTKVTQCPDTNTSIVTTYNYQGEKEDNTSGHSFAGAGQVEYTSDYDPLMQSSSTDTYNINDNKYSTAITSYRRGS